MTGAVIAAALVRRVGLWTVGQLSSESGQPSGSGNVLLDCRATSPFSSSEPHEQWATGTLYDNVHAPLTARFWKNINIGWAGANTVFWNCEGSFLVQKPPTAQNYTFGHVGVNAVVFNIHLCYAAGNGESGMAIPSDDLARERVDNFANGWLAAGAGAVPVPTS